METNPLISCVCLTYKRAAQLKNAIACFLSQSYPNKELVIIGHQDDGETQDVVQKQMSANVRFYNAPKLSIGALRNLSIEKSRGEYFCQWDDDDWHNPRRLEFQMAETHKSKKEANVLAYWIMFDKVNGQAYLSFPLMWAGTILCSRKIYESGIRYPEEMKNEDTGFMVSLFKKNCIAPLIMPWLYIYVYHGSNTWESDHFSSLFRQAQKLSPDASDLISKIISNHFTNEKSSELISSRTILGEFDYFRVWSPGLR